MTCPAIPSASDSSADHFANRRVLGLTASCPASQARSAYAAYASTPTVSVIEVSSCSDGQIPGSGATMPKPVSRAMPTQPDHTSAAAGTARTSSGQDRTAVREHVTAADRSWSAAPGWSGQVVWAAEVLARPGPVVPTRVVSAVRAVMLITTLPQRRAGAVRQSARPAPWRHRTSWPGHRSTWARSRCRCRFGRRRRGPRRTPSSALPRSVWCDLSPQRPCADDFVW